MQQFSLASARGLDIPCPCIGKREGVDVISNFQCEGSVNTSKCPMTGNHSILSAMICRELTDELTKM